MKKIVSLGIFIVLTAFAGYSQSISTTQKVENIKTFAKVYGYVKYFHPSDEAAAINWDNFATYGCQQVENSSSTDELIAKLNELFIPIAPSIKIFKTNENLIFDVKSITPKDKKNYSEIYWQHLGLEDKTRKGNAYKSKRVNRPDKNMLFIYRPKMGECITKKIGEEISCIIPLCLYGNTNNTYPKADSEKLNKLNQLVNTIKASDKTSLYSHFADLVIIYCEMQHFYPYFDVAKINWEEAFTTALHESYKNNSELDFLNTLKKFTAQLKDGHIWITSNSDEKGLMPAIKWELIENQLVITKVLSEKIDIPVGSIVEKINGIPTTDYLAPFAERIPSATKGNFNYRLEYESLMGNPNDSLDVTLTTPDKKSTTKKLGRYLDRTYYSSQIKNTTQIKQLQASPKTIYINLDKASMDDIDNVMDQLTNAKTIICDLRGYPNSNHLFIQHLLTIDDTASSWMRVPQIIYPDYQVSGYENFSWKLKAIKPHLSAKIIFIIDGSAISYAESFMGFIEGYKLATIIGEPTAGTNGNVNTIVLPSGCTFRFTGMKVVRHDGTQQHGIGILPNIYVHKTIKGVIEGRDEFLEKALELAK